jgi:hypothetical protein
MSTELCANCPECGHKVYLKYDDFAPEPEVVDCSGCKAEFAVKVEMVARLHISKIKWKKQAGEQGL